MRIAVFGSLGQTGMHFTKMDLEKGLTVIVLVRNPNIITIANDNLKVIEGSIVNLQYISAANYIVSNIMCYTIARPLAVVDSNLTRVYSKTNVRIPPKGKCILREDLAHFLLCVIEDGNMISKSVGLTY